MPRSTAKNPREPRINPLWWWVVGAFVVLISAWGLLVMIASRHAPETVELESSTPPATEAVDSSTEPDSGAS